MLIRLTNAEEKLDNCQRTIYEKKQVNTGCCASMEVGQPALEEKCFGSHLRNKKGKLT